MKAKDELIEEFLQRRSFFNEYLKKNRSLGLFTCPCCGYPTLHERGGYEICEVCWWEDDGQDDVDADQVLGGPNGSLSLTVGRIQFAQKLAKCVQELNGELNDSPSDVLAILDNFHEELSDVMHRSLYVTDRSDPVHEEYAKVSDSIFTRLVKGGEKMKPVIPNSFRDLVS